MKTTTLIDNSEEIAASKLLRMHGLRFKREHLIAALCLALLIGVYAYLVPHIWARVGADWFGTYVPAVRALVAGQNPYKTAHAFMNPVWILLPLIPLGMLPQRLGLIFFFVLILVIYIFIGLKLHAQPISLTAFMLSPGIFLSLQQLNIDAIVLLGFLLPAPLGLFFVLAKPQIGIGMAVYWLVEAWRTGGLRKVLITFAPVTIAQVITQILYGSCLKVASDTVILKVNSNYSIFPLGRPGRLGSIGHSPYI